MSRKIAAKALLTLVTVFLSAASILTSHSSIASEKSIESRMSDYVDIDNKSFDLEANNKISSIERNRMMADAYVSMFSPLQTDARLRAANSTNVRLLLRAASKASFYAMNEEYATDAARDLSELESQHAAIGMDYLEVYKNYIGARMFEAAKKLADSHPVSGMEEIPDMRISRAAANYHGPKAWQLVAHQEDFSFELIPVDLHGLHIVIVGHPLCHFTQNAIAFIYKDKELDPIFAHYALWLAPPSQTLHAKLFDQWNGTHPEQKMMLANKYLDWSMIDDWDTPTFYFIKDGKEVAKVQGWPQGGHKKELLGAIRELGIPDN